MIRSSIAGHLLRMLLLVALWSGVVWSAQAFAQEVTTVYLVRHAEKDGPGEDAGLTEPGKARARALAHVLADVKLSAIFVSSVQRTSLTAQPTREMTDPKLELLQRDTTKTAEEIQSTFKGKNVLVVGHSDSVGKIAEKLGADGIGTLPADAFDRLFVIHIDGEQVVLERLRYGAP
ncbi:phosphoglycerate mutase family protein [Devosia insulae]|uniref:phosphoglycerate mutase family protein n=1 Tax=Devosia insulae TaxID=408174 RepID=UPI00159F2B65|nr:phosphoglycerate mutase family protein [Devosia insulae]